MSENFVLTVISPQPNKQQHLNLNILFFFVNSSLTQVGQSETFSINNKQQT
jgi:hypothetical protein